MDSSRRVLATSLGLLILRLGVGGYMASHGLSKFRMALNGEFDKFPDPTGFLGNQAALVLAVFGEFVCPLLVVFGLLTRLACVPVVITMAVAAFIVHQADPWSSETAAKAFFAGTSKTWASKEPALLYLIPFLALMFIGAGRISIDALLFGRSKAVLAGVPRQSP